MPNLAKPKLLAELKNRYGSIRKLDSSQSLYEIGDGAVRIYFRYSKLHKRSEAFFGLRCHGRGLAGFAMKSALLHEVIELHLLKTAGREQALLVAFGDVARWGHAGGLRFRAF